MTYIECLKQKKEERNFMWKQLAEGICDKSYITRMVQGERFPRFYIKNRILGRAGVDITSIPCYLGNLEEEMYLSRKKIIDLFKEARTWGEVEGDRFNECKKELKLYEEKYALDDIDKQFILDMKASMYLIEGDGDPAEGLIEEVIALSMPKLDLERIDECELSPIEVWYLYKMYYCKLLTHKFKNPKNDLRKIRYIIEYVDKKFEGDIRSILYAVFVCEYAKINECYALNDDDEVLKCVENALGMLSKGKRMYCLSELIKIKKSFTVDLDEIVSLDRFLEGIEGLKEYGYREGTLYLTADLYLAFDPISFTNLICKRRNTMGISLEKLSEGICNKRTIQRFENGETELCKKNVDCILTRLCLPAYLDNEISNKEKSMNSKSLLRVINVVSKANCPVETMFFTEDEISYLVNNINRINPCYTDKVQEIIEYAFIKRLIVDRSLMIKYYEWKLSYLRNDKEKLAAFSRKVLYYSLTNGMANDIKRQLVFIEYNQINDSKDYSVFRKNLQRNTVYDFYRM